MGTTMPTCGSQVILCDLPVRFDTYVGCSHGCEYCFVQRKNNAAFNVAVGEGVNELRGWVRGDRKVDSEWCDWDIPLHWGGMSDPFQPSEKQHRNSLACLRVFAETGYPVVFSTKGQLAVDAEYLDLIRRCNIAAQVSIVAPSYNRMESGAPPFTERVAMIESLAKNTKRVIARIQPLKLGVTEEVINTTIPLLSKAGCFGVTVEGFKATRGMKPEAGMRYMGADLVYPVSLLEKALGDIKEAAHAHGMKFYSAENRLRNSGDDQCCCGVADIEGWRVNRCNLNHLYFGGYEETPRQLEKGTGDVFAAIPQGAGWHQLCRPTPFAKNMNEVARSRAAMELLGYVQRFEQEGLEL